MQPPSFLFLTLALISLVSGAAIAEPTKVSFPSSKAMSSQIPTSTPRALVPGVARVGGTEVVLANFTIVDEEREHYLEKRAIGGVSLPSI